MLLHYAQNSRAVRVAWLLEELNLNYKVINYKLGDKKMRDEDFKKINPLGRVPVLEDEGIRISESGAIIQYILSKYSKEEEIVWPHDQTKITENECAYLMLPKSQDEFRDNKCYQIEYKLSKII